MSRSLSHRSSPSIQKSRLQHVSPQVTLGCLTSSRGCHSHEIRGGIAGDDDLTIALCGHLWLDGCDSLNSLLRQFRAKGSEIFPSLSGMFVLAIQTGDRTILVRDGAGARTVAYGLHQGRLLFAIEPKAILSVPGFSRRINLNAVAQYLTFSFIPGEETMVRGVHELPAGCSVSFRPGTEPKVARYFHPERLETESTATDYSEQFRCLLSSAVARRLPIAETPTVFLSGGLDSSVVAAEVARQSAGKVKTFALHFGKEYPHELPYARAVADFCKTDHHEIEIKPKSFLPSLRRMIWHLDDPIGDPITMPNFELASRVREFTSAGFNGEGGDPCFGGPKNGPMLMHHWYGGVERPANFREQQYLASYRRGFEELGRLLAPDVLAEIDLDQHLHRIVSPFFAADRPATFLDKLCLINIRLKGAHLILPKVERMFGAHGIEPLSPLFDDRLVRFSFQIPSRLKLQNGIEKLVIKQAYANALPREIIERPKSGMRVPVHYWFQGELKRYARKILSRRAVKRAGLFNPDRVAQLLAYNIEEGPGRYGIRLWMLLTLELWRRIVIEREPV